MITHADLTIVILRGSGLRFRNWTAPYNEYPWIIYCYYRVATGNAGFSVCIRSLLKGLVLYNPSSATSIAKRLSSYRDPSRISTAMCFNWVLLDKMITLTIVTIAYHQPVSFDALDFIVANGMRYSWGSINSLPTKSLYHLLIHR